MNPYRLLWIARCRSGRYSSIFFSLRLSFRWQDSPGEALPPNQPLVLYLLCFSYSIFLTLQYLNSTFDEKGPHYHFISELKGLSFLLLTYFSSSLHSLIPFFYEYHSAFETFDYILSFAAKAYLEPIPTQHKSTHTGHMATGLTIKQILCHDNDKGIVCLSTSSSSLTPWYAIHVADFVIRSPWQRMYLRHSFLTNFHFQFRFVSCFY